jgi:peptidoglycan/xylan/chitin deacetylase (PgdA/CDA1 family)
MTWDQIKYCSNNNIEIGSHGYLHRNLLQITAQSILENEINASSIKIKQEIGKSPNIFAFANAVGSNESKEFVKKAGYQFTLIGMDQLFKWDLISKSENVEIPRINISRSDWREEYLRALGFHARIKYLFKFY